jgi:acyl-CoA thioester hydrolase
MHLAVRWGDMDSLNHVNNAEYMRYFEEARVAWSSHHDLRRHREEGGMIIARATIHYKKPVVYPATLRSEIFVHRIGRSSFELHQTLTHEGEEAPSTTGDYAVVWFDYAQGRSAPIPPRLRAILEGQS